ncbi:VanZ family protein [Brumicola blandensis]|uniref:VanZ family protein n=1 Tax=Brumicola blandensis TaxID=3075611 RepID=A0AAW8R616_9ALTE|nr:VanZ family protein [Alteromonas sp. W409]MDT0582628.1 VanZ family protein [Alteromonas sp. W409]
MKSIFFIIAFLIVYGSLYPFHFSANSMSPESLQALLNFDLRQTSLTDIIANIVLFIPFGLFIRLVFPNQTTKMQLLNLALFTFVFAYGIQALQLFTEDRKPWGGDAVWNMVGYFVGLVLFSFSQLRFLRSIQTLSINGQISLVLAISIIVLELAPFAPSIDLDVLKQNVKALLSNPTIDWYWTVEGTLYWLVPFYLLKLAVPSFASLPRLSVIVFSVLLAKFIIVSSNVNLTLLVSGINALIVWGVFGRRINIGFLAVLMLIKIVSNGLHPFVLSEQTQAFNWIPFTGSMNGNILFNIVVFAKKIAIYGATIWLLFLWSQRLLMSTLVCGAALLMTELLQTRFVDSTPESTDLVLAVFIAFILKQVIKPSLSHNKDKPLASTAVINGEQLMKNSNADSSSNKSSKKIKVVAVIAILLSTLLGLSTVLSDKSSSDIVVRQAPWANVKHPPLIFDHHTHSNYSDGSLSIKELTELAYLEGCHAFAITDHSNDVSNFRASRIQDIKDMRAQFPVMLIFGGIELGMPSYSQRERVNIITLPEYEELMISKIMQALIDAKGVDKAQQDLVVLEAINTIERAKHNTIKIYNHPSRRDRNDGAIENYRDIKNWNKDFNHITAVAGAPGRQKAEPIGDYKSEKQTIDRWDPFVAEVGGTWDKLLSEGEQIWGAIATTDFHDAGTSYAPCEFSRTHVNAPTHDYKGIVEAIKAGTFWADHGKLLDDYQFTITSQDTKVVAYPGSTIDLAGNDNILNVEIAISKMPEYADDFFRFELISNCNSKKTVLESTLMPPEKSKITIPIPIFEQNREEQCYVRSRIIRESIEPNRLSAYSNPIFIKF